MIRAAFLLCCFLFFAPSAWGGNIFFTSKLGADGRVTVQLSGTFASCTTCDPSGQNCVTTDTGAVSLSQNMYNACSASGKGSASCSKIFDRGTHGTHTFTGRLKDCRGIVTDTYVLTLDNTPEVAVTSPLNGSTVSGPFDITGKAVFQPTRNAVKGTISLYVDGSSTPQATKKCTTEVCLFSWKELQGKEYEMYHGGHAVELKAAGGGAAALDISAFTVDNAPAVVLTSPSHDDMVPVPFDIAGTAAFKPTQNATKGMIFLHINDSLAASKTCATEECSFRHEEIEEKKYELRHGGTHTVKLTASSAWGGSVSRANTFTVANIPAAITSPENEEPSDDAAVEDTMLSGVTDDAAAEDTTLFGVTDDAATEDTILSGVTGDAITEDTKMSAPQSSRSDIFSFAEGGDPIPHDKFAAWSRDSDLEVQGALYSFLSEASFYTRIVPPLSTGDYQEFALHYWERCMRENPDGEWADTRYGAARALTAFIKNLWETEENGELLKEIKIWLERMYREGDEDMRTCLETGTLEHLFVNPEIAAFFADWLDDPLLGEAFNQALNCAGINSFFAVPFSADYR
jgi:hypothetical protein